MPGKTPATVPRAILQSRLYGAAAATRRIDAPALWIALEVLGPAVVVKNYKARARQLGFASPCVVMNSGAGLESGAGPRAPAREFCAHGFNHLATSMHAVRNDLRAPTSATIGACVAVFIALALEAQGLRCMRVTRGYIGHTAKTGRQSNRLVRICRGQSDHEVIGNNPAGFNVFNNNRILARREPMFTPGRQLRHRDNVFKHGQALEVTR